MLEMHPFAIYITGCMHAILVIACQKQQYHFLYHFVVVFNKELLRVWHLPSHSHAQWHSSCMDDTLLPILLV